MGVAAFFSGLALAHAGLGAVHGMAGVLGGYVSGAPHGALCARLLPAVMTANRRRLNEEPERQIWLERRYGEAAALILNRPSATADDLLTWVTERVEDYGVPRLRTFGLAQAEVTALIAQAERASSTKSNPASLTKQDWEDVLRSAW